MRSTSLVLAALTGLAVSTFAAPANAFTPASSAGVGLAAQSVDPVTSVHCRSYKHRGYGHGWGYGCGRGGGVHVSIHEREGGRVHRRGFEEREGRARVGVHASTRSETNVRSRERTTTRGEVRSGGGEMKSGSSRSSTTGGSSKTGNRSEGSSGGTSGGGSSSGGGGQTGGSR